MKHTMKLLFSLLTAIICVVSAVDAGALRCKRIQLIGPENLAQDLKTHIWEISSDRGKSLAYFNADQTAVTIPAGSRTGAARSMTWAVGGTDLIPMLILEDEEGWQSYIIAPTCDGLVALSGMEGVMRLNVHREISVSQTAMLRDQMVGHWQTTPGNNNRKNGRHGADVRMIFKADGTYALSAGPDHYHSVHQGRWDISADGEYLFLYKESGLPGGPKYILESVRIVALDYEDMVIDTKKLPRILGEYEGRNTMYLARVVMSNSVGMSRA